MYLETLMKEMEKKEREANFKRLVVILLVRPHDRMAKTIMANFNYMHYNTGSLCNAYAVGFGLESGEKEFPVFNKVRGITQVNDNAWYYSDKAFYDLKDYLEHILDWHYSGESTAIVLQNDPGKKRSLDFRGAVSIDLECAIIHGFSFNRFMEEIMHNLKAELIGGNVALDNNQCNLDVEEITKDAFMRSLLIDLSEKESLYSQCVQRITPREVM